MKKKVKNNLIEQYVRPQIRQIQAYHVQPAEGFIKLDAMENPYVWSKNLQQQWLERVQEVAINRYPDAHATKARQALYEVMGIPSQAGLVVGNGSDELIQMLAMVLAGPGRTILAPAPSFVMYDMIARFVGSEFVSVPLTDNFELDLPAMLAAIEEHQPAVTFIAYPNNPTGNAFDKQAIAEIISVSPGLVVIDEAYHAFAGDSYLGDVLQYSNVVVMRTLSKLGLAGLRFGFMAGPEDLLAEVEKVRLPYNINGLTQASVEFAFENMDFFDEHAATIVAQRAVLMKELSAHSIVERVYPSEANFVLFKVLGDAVQVHQQLKQNGVLIKNLHQPDSALSQCLRVTVSTPEENAAFLAALPTA